VRRRADSSCADTGEFVARRNRREIFLPAKH
jgi:hypothetical protein